MFHGILEELLFTLSSSFFNRFLRAGYGEFRRHLKSLITSVTIQC